MISIRVDTNAAISKLSDLELRQLPFAMKLALNATALEIETEERKHVQSAFTIRRPWVITNIKIGKSDFATKDKASVTISVPDDSVLVKFELGGVKTPRAGGKSIAIPLEAKRGKTDIVANSQRPRAFAFTQGFTSLKTGVTIYRGNHGTFMVQRPDGSGAIFQRLSARATKKRVGPHQLGRDPALKPLWLLKPQARIAPELGFYTTGSEVAARRFGANMADALARALATAR